MNKLKLFAVGDISLQTNDDPFKNVSNLLKEKNMLFGNLETVLSRSGEKAKKAVVLQSNPKNVEYLKKIGFDVLNVANNHILDLGPEGFHNTLELLNKSNIKFIGAKNNKYGSKNVIINKNGLKIGFIAYTIGRFKKRSDIIINKIQKDKILSEIKSLEKKADFIIVSLHWGTENVFYPSPEQIKLAHEIIDNGANLILGHHPHVVQGIESYKNGLIAYSLGNFQFDPILSQSKTNKSIILSIEINEFGINDFEIIPIEINKCIPELLEGKPKFDYLDFISEISKPIANIKKLWWFQQIGEEYLISNINSYRFRIRRYGLFPLLEMLIWLVAPFCIYCYLGIIKNKISG